MIARFANYHNPECDFCGHMLPAEKSDEEAAAAMVKEGWIKRDGKDVCQLCQQLERAFDIRIDRIVR